MQNIKACKAINTLTTNHQNMCNCVHVNTFTTEEGMTFKDNKQACENVIKKELPRFINLSASKFFYPLSEPQNMQTCPQIHKELRFSSSEFFLLSCWRDHVWGGDPGPPSSVPSESSLVWNCLSVRKKCSLSNLLSSCHHQGLLLSPGSCFPSQKEKKKPSPDLITLMFHQV